MAKILVVTDNMEIISTLRSTLLDHEFLISDIPQNIVDIMKVETPDFVIFDTTVEFDYVHIFRTIRDFQAIRLILIGDKEVSQEILDNSHQYIQLPINPIILEPTISAGLKAKKSLIKLSSSNKELANSLYQLNVLYNTSSQLAGSLSRNKLVDVVNEGIEKSLNSNIVCTLSFKDDRTPVLLISSNYKLSERLVQALKLRAVLNYKNSGINTTEMFTIDDIELEQDIKHTINEYDFEILNYHKLLSYITVEDKCYGYSEIFREKEFSSDDEKCFRTLINQVTQPLKSAILYQEKEQKNKELARLERIKSEFISIVTHELKTPLTSIKNAFDIISAGKAGDVTEPMSKFLDMAKRNVKKLSTRVNELLDMQKIEAGEMDYNIKSASIIPVINEVTQNLTQSALKKDIKLTTKIIGDIKKVNADLARIEQVLGNLVSNAIKFTPEKGSITISAKMVDADDIKTEDCFKPYIKQLKGEYVQVCVSDTGIGIPKEDLIHVFDKFKQLENSLSREVGGSGLGLAIVKQMVTAHEGAIWCDSEPDKGSDFYFILPVSEE